MFNFLQRLFGSARPAPAESPLTGKTAQWLVVGLGNPGTKYEATKHNVGYMAVDQLLSERGVQLAPVPGVRALAVVENNVAFVRSTTFMNLSGEGIAPVAESLGIVPDHIVVLHDELDLPVGDVRVKKGGNENGHNGLKSLSEKLGTRDYIRVRIGIGRPDGGQSIPDWVLGPVASGEELDDQITRAAHGAELVVSEGLAKAQNKVNAKR